MKYIINYRLFNEALLPSQFRKYVKEFNKERYEEKFQKFKKKYDGDRNAYRLYLPYEAKDYDQYYIYFDSNSLFSRVEAEIDVDLYKKLLRNKNRIK